MRVSLVHAYLLTLFIIFNGFSVLFSQKKYPTGEFSMDLEMFMQSLVSSVSLAPPPESIKKYCQHAIG